MTGSVGNLEVSQTGSLGERIMADAILDPDRE